MKRFHHFLFYGFIGCGFSCQEPQLAGPKEAFPSGALSRAKSEPQKSSRRGTLLTTTPVASFSKAELDERFKRFGITARSGVSVYKLVYLTEIPTVPVSIHEASGIVVVPDAPAPVYPWISLQHGTITGKADAPSVSYAEGLLEGSQGFFTVVQDYIGFGSASDLFHPYMIEQSYASSGIDMLRAARIFALIQNMRLGPLFLRGYSEGGYGTMVLQKAIETNHSDEFQAVASAPAAGPYDLVVTSKVLGARPTVNPVNLPFVLLSYNRWFSEDSGDLNKMLNIDTEWAYQLFGGDYLTEELFSILPWETTKLFKADFVNDVISDEPFSQEAVKLLGHLSDQSLHNKSWAPSTPTRLYHCIDDTAVPVEATQSAYASFKALNSASPVEAVLIPSPDPTHPYDHTSCPGFLSSLVWFGEILGAMDPSTY